MWFYIYDKFHYGKINIRAHHGAIRSILVLT